MGRLVCDGAKVGCRCVGGEGHRASPKNMLVLRLGMERSNIRSLLAVESGDMHEGSIQAANPIPDPMQGQ
jgi:hypothetical protein